MSDLVKSLKIKCVEAGTSLNQICKRIGLNPQVITSWEKQEPKSIRTLKAIEAAIAEVQSENNGGPAAAN